MSKHIAQSIGIDLSTTSFKLGVRDAAGNEDYAACDVRGATKWRGQPAFLLDEAPGMFLDTIAELRSRGWSFQQPGALSFSVRQHDMCVMDEAGHYLIPTLSWECHVAEKQVEQLREQGAEAVVGRIEPRFILPKLLWAIGQELDLKQNVRRVAATGDVLAWRLTNEFRLSSSDALSNGLLDQQSKKLAIGVLEQADVSSAWFPNVLGSGRLVGVIQDHSDKVDPWSPVREALIGWSVYAGLGDNHAGAVGCGLADFNTIVISAGSSGTVCRLAEPGARLAGNAACFEYYDDRLLLMMLARCSLWYEDFLKENGWAKQHADNNDAALNCDLSQIVWVKEGQYPPTFAALDRGGKIASVQFSIALELLLLVKSMLVEVADNPARIERVALTGGLSQAPLFRGVLHSGLRMLIPEASLNVSARSGGLAFQTATFGALINASLHGDISKLGAVAQDLCKTVEAEPLSQDKADAIAAKLKPHLIN